MPDTLVPFCGAATGSLSFPQTDRHAFPLAANAADNYRKLALPAAVSEVSPGDRADVSWISTEDPDRDREVLLSKGMNDTHFAMNPVITIKQLYNQPPVSKFIVDRAIRQSGAHVERPAARGRPLSSPPSWSSVTHRSVEGVIARIRV